MNIKTFDELLKLIKEEGAHFGVSEIYEFIQYKEAEFLEISVSEFRSRVLNILNTMKKSVENGLKSNELSKSGLSGENTEILKKAFQKNGHSLIFSPLQKRVVLYTISIIEENARMGKIAACPTAGSCGIAAGVLTALKDEMDLSDEILINALITAGIIGEIISDKMALAGAVAGCQAECGAAAGMAAGAVCYIFGGKNEDILNAAALALKNILGLTCDPVAGLVEIPCVKRNIFMAIHALVAAELSLVGVKSKIPLDEVIDAMKETGELMVNSLKESSEAGLAKTKTGIEIEAFLRQKLERR